jgi:hypothetical protein
MIGKHNFHGRTSLTDINFSLDSRVRKICGFVECSSLRRIEIPSSVDVIGKGCFDEWGSLHRVKRFPAMPISSRTVISKEVGIESILVAGLRDCIAGDRKDVGRVSQMFIDPVVN